MYFTSYALHQATFFDLQLTVLFISFYFRMGSFTSMPKIKPVANADDNDVDYCNLEDLTTVLNECQEQLDSLPSPIPRQWRSTKTSSAAAVIESEGNFELVHISVRKIDSIFKYSTKNIFLNGPILCM